MESNTFPIQDKRMVRKENQEANEGYRPTNTHSIDYNHRHTKEYVHNKTAIEKYQNKRI